MKHAVFFCENCAKPVPLDAEECPHCHSRFTAVQCPECSFVGEARLFSSGCPQCGFLSKGSEAVSAQPLGEGDFDLPPEVQEPTPRRSYLRSKNRLPGWFYTVASILLLIVLIGLGVILFKMI